MAKRLCFIQSVSEPFIEEEFKFKYYTGFAISQKQRSIRSLHEEIKKAHPKARILEISSKSESPIGVALSAFNLKYAMSNGQLISLENVFQASKVFELGGPYLDLLLCSPGEAKKDKRLTQSGALTHFQLEDITWELEPKTLFYDWIYLNALTKHQELIDAIVDYDFFTDIEFNHQKSINCQARTVAIFKSLQLQNSLNRSMNSKEIFKKIYKPTAKQLTLDI